MKMKLFNTFLVLMGLLLIKPVYGNDPDLNDRNCNGENCDSANNAGQNYFLKLKYLTKIDFRVSLGDFYRVGRSRYQVSSEKFCAIAYSCEENSNCNNRDNRKMHRYQMQVFGLVAIENQSFVLSNGDSTIPVTLRLLGVSGDATEGYDQVMHPGKSVSPSIKQGDNFCRDNEFVIVAEIDATDLKSASGDYEGEFDVKVDFASPSMSAEDELDIELELPPTILISGLEDMPLTHTENSDIKESQDFCVYVSGGDRFQIKAESQVGNGSFELSNGKNDDNIGYEVTVGRVNGGEGNSVGPINEGGYYSHKSWKGAKDLFCEKKGENMELTLNIAESEISDKPAGVYEDTLHLTVQPL